jgi:PAS domain S-box-containing protein
MNRNGACHVGDTPPHVFQTLVDRMETGVYAVDVQQRIVYWNQGAEKVTGFLSQEMLGRVCGSNLVVEQKEHNPALCVHSCPLESGLGDHVRHEVVTYFRHKSGHVVWVRLWTMAVKNRSGDIVAAMKVFSERVQVAELRAEEKGRPRPEDLDIETGLPGRAATEVVLREQIERATQQHALCGLILVQLEELEEFERRHGKEAGHAIFARDGAHVEGHDATLGFPGAVGRGTFSGRAAGVRDGPAGKSGPAHEAGRRAGGNFVVGRPAVAAGVGGGGAGRVRGHD